MAGAGIAEPTDKPRKGSLAWLQGLVCGAVAVLATPTAILLAVLLAPTGLAFVLDSRPSRPILRPVLLWGLAATIVPLATLWRSGDSLDASLASVTNVSVPAMAWAAQAAGWLLAELVPVVVRLALDGRAVARAAHLRAARGRYEAEWGISPTGAPHDVSAAP